MGFIGFLNTLLAFLFPFWPWEIFIVYPFVLEFYSRKADKSEGAEGKAITETLVLVVSYFAAVFSGVGHTLGLIQTLDVLLLGGDGICNALPSPDGGHLWCVTMSLHLAFMIPMGYYFIYIVISPDRLMPPGGNLKATFYFRTALFFFVGGISQIIPYLGQMAKSPSEILSILTSPGFYSGRAITPGLTEFLEPIIWISYGIYSSHKAKSLSAEATYLEIV